jgi:hypothetical protein
VEFYSHATHLSSWRGAGKGDNFTPMVEAVVGLLCHRTQRGAAGMPLFNPSVGSSQGTFVNSP